MRTVSSSPAPAVDLSKYPTTSEQFSPESQVGRARQSVEDRQAEYKSLCDLTARHEARRRECLATIRDATPQSDFAALAARQMEAQVLEETLIPLVAQQRRAAEALDFARAEADRAWGKYRNLLFELSHGNNRVERPIADIQRELERLL